MTIVAQPSSPAEVTVVEDERDASDVSPPQVGFREVAVDARTEAPPIRWGVLVVSWLVITAAGIWLVLASMGPLTHDRDQQALLGDYRVEIENASNEAFGLPGIEVPTRAPAVGAAVGVLDIAAIGVSEVVVEGTTPEQTRQGPGHVVGTAGPGQPGNSVIVAHRRLYGGPFGSLGDLEQGDRILVTTVQGPSVYAVEHVGTHTLAEPEGPEPASARTEAVVDAVEEEVLPDGELPEDLLYGPSADDRLTLVTSAGPPWAGDEALVVVARMDGTAFEPTPQGGRTGSDDGRSGDPGITASLGLALLGYLLAVVTAVWLFRHVPWRSAYLISLPLLIALTVVLAEQVSLAVPAWS